MMMMIAIIGLCLLIFAIVFAVFRIRRNKALTIMQNASLEITNQAFKETIALICVPGFDGKNAKETHKAEMISDVWGKASWPLNTPLTLLRSRQMNLTQ